MALTKVTYSMIDGATVNVLDYGAVGDGIADDTAAIQAAIDASAGTTVVLPVGTYKITSTIRIADSETSIVGLGRPSIGSTNAGAIIRYYGTGTAVSVGVNPNVNGTFIRNIWLENLRIEVDNNTACALLVWHASTSYFKKISLFGNKGAGRVGLQVNAGTSNIYEEIFVNGNGQTPPVARTDFLEYGCKLQVGFAGDLATTTVFRRCYITGCNRGVGMDYIFDFEDCVFESCYRGVESLSYMTSQFMRCWWEDNENLDIYFSGASGGDDCQIIGGRINSYARQTFFNTGNGVKRLSIQGVNFTTSNANPIIFSTGSVVAKNDGTVTLTDCLFPTDCVIGGSGAASNRYPAVKIKNQDIAIYRFIQKAITLSFANDMDTEDAIAGKAYIMPANGNILGVNLWYTGALGGGNFDIATKINGSAVPDLSFPTIPSMTSEPQVRRCDNLDSPFNEGDSLTFYLNTSGFSGGDFIAEVIVAHGLSGRS